MRSKHLQAQVGVGVEVGGWAAGLAAHLIFPKFIFSNITETEKLEASRSIQCRIWPANTRLHPQPAQPPPPPFIVADELT